MKVQIHLAVCLALVLVAGGCTDSEQVPGANSPPEATTEGHSATPAGTLALNESPAAAEPVNSSAPAEAAPTVASAAPVEEATVAPPVADGTVYGGVFTVAQANRGQAVQQRECGACHSPADWQGGRVLISYAGGSALDMLEHIRMTMPMDGPGRLSMQEYTDILAYMFHLNGLPAGGEELAADEASLGEVRVEYRR